MNFVGRLLSGLALIAFSGCVRAAPIQRATTPRSLTDTLVGLALDSVASPHVSRPLLLFATAAEIPAMIFGPGRVYSLMRAAPEIDSVLASRVFAAQPPQRWQGALSLSR